MRGNWKKRIKTTASKLSFGKIYQSAKLFLILPTAAFSRHKSAIFAKHQSYKILNKF